MTPSHWVIAGLLFTMKMFSDHLNDMKPINS